MILDDVLKTKVQPATERDCSRDDVESNSLTKSRDSPSALPRMKQHKVHPEENRTRIQRLTCCVPAVSPEAEMLDAHSASYLKD